MEINLKEFTKPGSSILVGRDHGLRVRTHLNLDSVDKGSERVLVLIPGDVLAMTSSFFLGLFEESINTLDVYGFRQQYTFQCGFEKMLVINECIERVKSRMM